MARPELPPDLRRFILTSVPSVPYLEAVLLLRAESTQHWTARIVARRLYLPEARAQELLQALGTAGVAQEQESAGEPAYRYQPATPELREMIDRTAAHYAADLVGVTDLIHSKVDKRAQQFADAFRWRKDS